MKCILIKNVTKNNLKNFSVEIPLQKLVTIVGPSGSGKSTLIEYLYNNSIKSINKVELLEQKVILPKVSKLSLGEFNLQKLKAKLSNLKKNELLIVDEPCAGFCKSERELILKLLKNKVKEGYSIICVEHTKEIIANSDYIIELGPGAGKYGGKLIFQGTIEEFKKSNTITAKYVYSKDDKKKQIVNRKTKLITLSKINKNNFRNYSFSFPINNIVCITGSSGKGKTTLLNLVYSSLFKGANAWKYRIKDIKVDGKQNIRRSFFVEQTPIGDHPSSTLATYTKVWDNIREIFAEEKLAKQLKLNKSDFIITKNILEKGFPKKVSQLEYKNKNINNVLNLTIDEALELFKTNSLIVRKLSFLQEVGLGYLVLGQRSSTLSGGEAQRVRVANILSKKLGDRCIYIFDTPSRGLHLKDIPVLLSVFRKIVAKKNTILIADNREELFNNCDYVITL